MFKENYKSEIDKLKPDDAVKDKIRQALQREEKTVNVRKRAYLNVGIAAALCGAILVSAVGILGRGVGDIPESDTAFLETPKNYDGVYEALEKFKPTFWDKYGFGYYTNKAVDEGIVEYADDADGIAYGEKNKGAASSDKGGDHSETTTQVEGVDEADIIKTDGKFIYILSSKGSNQQIKIVDTTDGLKQLSSIKLANDNYTYAGDMYLQDDRLVVLSAENEKNNTLAIIYDVSDPRNPKKVETCVQSGSYNTSRLIGNRLYVISNYYIHIGNAEKENAESYVPKISCKNFNDTVAPESIHFYDECNRPEYTVISAFDIKNGKMLSGQSVLGGSYTVYAGTQNIITASISNENKTQVARFKIEGEDIKLTATGDLKGSLLNQFSIDEYKGYFRFVLTEYNVKQTVNSLVVLNGDLKQVGSIENIAPNEQVYSVRFMGDTAYFVTFRQVDPLFSVDVSNPEKPKIIGALKIPGFSNYLFPYGEGTLLGIGQNADEITGRSENIKLSMFDISNPANVKENSKTDVDSNYSAALYNHKAILADYVKNIISFAANGNDAQQTLYVFSYKNGKFTERLADKWDLSSGNVRPLYIGQTFYAIAVDEIRFYDINTFRKLGEMHLS